MEFISRSITSFNVTNVPKLSTVPKISLNTRKKFMAVSNFDVTLVIENSTVKLYYVLINASPKASKKRSSVINVKHFSGFKLN